MARHIGDLPHALEDGDRLARDLAGRRPAVFLDYDGTLTPIVDRPEDAVIFESVREAVRGLAARCPVGRENVEILSYRHEYDIRYATVVRVLRTRDRAGRETALETRRFVSMADMHQAAMQWKITPENWSGRVEIISALDGRITNRGVARYRQLEGRHLDPVSLDRVGRRHAHGRRPGGRTSRRG